MNKVSVSTMQLVGAVKAWVEGRISSERGATAVEYGLLVALIAGAIITAVILLGTNLSTLFNHTANTVSRNTPVTPAG